MKKRILILLILFCLASVNVYAIGITPSSIELDFKPNYREIFTFYATNNRDGRTIIEPYFGGDLEKYMRIINKTPVELEPGDYMSFQVELRLPSTLNKPGLLKTYIGVTEKTGPDSGHGAINALTAVESILTVKVPYPGKFAEADLVVDNVNLGETPKFKVNVENKGKETISFISGIIRIEDDAELVKELEINAARGLISQKRISIPVRFDAKDVKPGEYKATAIVDYDGFKAVDEEIWRLGDLFVNLTNYTREFEINKINRWEIYVQNRWNKPMKSVFAEAKIIQGGEQISIGARTPTLSLGPWQQDRLVAYWDTSGFVVGEYDAKITLFYENNKSENVIKINIIKPKKLQLQLPLIIKNVGLQAALLAIVSLVVLLDIIWLILVSRKKDKNVKKTK